jgi:hypothetical protein
VTSTEYRETFRRLRDALRAYSRAGEVSSLLARHAALQAALSAACELVRVRQLRTRAEWRERGPLERGREYLEEPDAALLAAAETALHGG